jgi:UDP-N-acetylmuramate dehydrogenase
MEVIRFATNNSLPILVLGGGSNVVLTRDWEGLAVHMHMLGFTVVEETHEHIRVHIAAGESWHESVVRTVSSGWYGLENLALIPGTVGAAPVQNIGAYGREICDFVVAVEALSLEDGSFHRFTREQCAFSYRRSMFHGHCPNKWLITGVELQLHTSPTSTVTYPSLIAQLQKEGIDPLHAHPTQVLSAVMRIRESKLPNPKDIPNVGSFFKNPVLTSEQYTQLKAQFPHVIAHPVGTEWKVAAAWLIEQAGYKGIERHGVGTYTNNALVLVNPGHCQGNAVIHLATDIQQRVAQQFGVALDIEPLII